MPGLPSSDDVNINDCPEISSRIPVYTSTSSTFYAPSEVSGPFGMHRELIRSIDSWQNSYQRRDTVLVQMDPRRPGFRGMMVGQVVSFLRLSHNREYYPCALLKWFVSRSEEPDPVTGMWIVEPELDNNIQTFGIVPLSSIVRACHLIPVYGEGFLPYDFHFSDSLACFQSFYVNHYIDYHSFETLP